MTAEEMRAIAHRQGQAWNDANPEIIDELYAPNYVNHFNGDDREAVKKAIRDSRVASSDLHFTQDDIIVEGDKLVIRWTARGTHTGDFMGAPATGKHLEFEGVLIARVANGQIVEEWSRGDDLSLMRQVGLLP